MDKATDHPMHQFLTATAADHMSRDVVTVTPALTLGLVEAMFEKFDYNAFPVMERGKIVGLFTKFDFLRAFGFTTTEMVPHYDELMNRPLAEVMSRDFVRVEPSLPLTRVLRLMIHHRMRSFPVVDAQDRLLGMISREDVMGALKATTTGHPKAPSLQ